MGMSTLDLVRALGQLPPKHRAVLVLYYYGGYKAREIAQIVDSSAATVRGPPECRPQSDPSHGPWHVVRDGRVIAVVNVDSLDGEACDGSGVGGA